MDPNQTGLEALRVFVGEWRTHGTMLDPAGSPGATFTATDSYEWVADESFLLHRWDAHMPDGRSQGIEVIGPDRERGGYLLHSYDNHGDVTTMHGLLERSRWLVGHDHMCFEGEFSADGRELSGTWLVRGSVQDDWRPLMSTTLTPARS